jgi:L-iditol 2-dehydrogenase
MYYSNSKVVLEELPIPEIGKGDILVKVMACGICGSDILEWYRIKRAPLVLGHELSGEVVEVGSEVTKFKKGDRVFSTHHVPCDTCHYCKSGHETACTVFQTVNNFDPGGFAEYLKISGPSLETGTFVLPDEVTYDQGSFIEPLGTAVRVMRKIEIRPGDSMLVLGSGIIGLIVIKLARVLGAGRIIATDIHGFRLEAAKKFGAAHPIHAKEDVPGFVKSVNNGRLADKVILCTGTLSAAQQAVESVDKGGTVMLFAVPNPGEELSIDFNPFWRNDVSIKTCYGAAPLDNMQAMELIRAGNVIVDDMITHRFSLADIGKGFSAASEGRECLKVIIEPGK